MPDLNSTAASVGELLKGKGQNIAVSESSCGGLLSGCLVSIPGASAYYVGGVVCYTRTAQKGLLQVPDETMSNIRASTEEYALRNARIVRQALGTTWALSETGASGPTGNRYGDASGHACIAVVGPVERSITVETGSTDREANMWAFAQAAFELLKQCINEAS